MPVKYLHSHRLYCFGMSLSHYCQIKKALEVFYLQLITSFVEMGMKLSSEVCAGLYTWHHRGCAFPSPASPAGSPTHQPAHSPLLLFFSCSTCLSCLLVWLSCVPGWRVGDPSGEAWGGNGQHLWCRVYEPIWTCELRFVPISIHYFKFCHKLMLVKNLKECKVFNLSECMYYGRVTSS